MLLSKVITPARISDKSYDTVDSITLIAINCNIHKRKYRMHGRTIISARSWIPINDVQNIR